MAPRRRSGASLRVAALLAAGAVCAAPTGGRGSFSEELFRHSLPVAEQSLHGRFIKQLVAGTLPQSVFKKYLHQDNLYLTKYARAFAVIGAKVDTTDELRWLVGKSAGYLREHGNGTLHIDERTFEREALPTTVAYTSFFMQAAWGEDVVLGYAAVLPCQRLYDWLFATINATMPIKPDNPYRDYIRQYADPANHRTSEEMEGFLDAHARAGISDELRARALAHYKAALEYEASFFDQAVEFCERHDCESLPPQAGAGARSGASRALAAAADAPASVEAAAALSVVNWTAAAALAGFCLAALAGYSAGHRGEGLRFSNSEQRRQSASSVPLVSSPA